MKDSDFHKIIDIVNAGGGWIPGNENAEVLLESTTKGEVTSVLSVTARDLKFHRCYFSLLNFIYDYLPPVFKKAVKKEDFYKWLKHLKGQYEVLFTFQNGTSLVEYESIAFGKMSDEKFKAYVREQLPYIYENVIHKYFQDELYDNIIATIEEEYEKFMQRLDQ